MLAVACAVVLEGAAIVGWLLVSAAPEREAVTPGRAVIVSESVGSLVTSEDDLLLKKIHEAVETGQLKPRQEGIRKFLRCRQPKAGSLNRQYLARFGSMRSQGGPHQKHHGSAAWRCIFSRLAGHDARAVRERCPGAERGSQNTPAEDCFRVRIGPVTEALI